MSRRRFVAAFLIAAAITFVLLTPIFMAIAATPRLFAQSATGLGLSVPELIVGLTAILAAVVGPLVGAIVKISSSKDEALRGQAEAHRTDRAERETAHLVERKAWRENDQAMAERYERLVEARAQDAIDARAAVIQLASDAMRAVDQMRVDVERALATPDTPNQPPARDSRASLTGLQPPGLPENAGPPTRRGGGRRSSNA